MRVAELDMTNSSPSGLRQRNDAGNHTCIPSSDSKLVPQSHFLVNTNYSQVYGRISIILLMLLVIDLEPAHLV